MKRGKTGQGDHLTLVKRPENQEIPQKSYYLQNTIAIKKCQEKACQDYQ